MIVGSHVRVDSRPPGRSPRKLVSGKSLHDAVHALGLTRYSIDDINEMAAWQGNLGSSLSSGVQAFPRNASLTQSFFLMLHLTKKLGMEQLPASFTFSGLESVLPRSHAQ